MISRERLTSFFGFIIFIIGTIWILSALNARSYSQVQEIPPPAMDIPVPSVGLPPTEASLPTTETPQSTAPQFEAPPPAMSLSEPPGGLPPRPVARPVPSVIPDGPAYVYDPSGRRDPFEAFGKSGQVVVDPAAPTPVVPTPAVLIPQNLGILTPLERYDLGELQLVGVMWDIRNPKAMVRDPIGKLHVVRKDTRIGRNNGFVAAVREGELVIVEPTTENGVLTAITKVMALTKK
jgi:type IV pilus assembly protein PilP